MATQGFEINKTGSGDRRRLSPSVSPRSIRPPVMLVPPVVVASKRPAVKPKIPPASVMCPIAVVIIVIIVVAIAVSVATISMVVVSVMPVAISISARASIIIAPICEGGAGKRYCRQSNGSDQYQDHRSQGGEFT